LLGWAAPYLLKRKFSECLFSTAAAKEKARITKAEGREEQEGDSE
jgi:hypothetical protein